MIRLNASNYVSKVVLCVISLITFILTLDKLVDVSLPNGSAPLFFAGAIKFLKGVTDVVSTHPFSIFVSLLSYAFKLDVISSMKLAASLLTALAPVALYLNAKFLTSDESIGLLTALAGALSFLNLAWTGNYHSVLGLVLFISFARLIGLYLREGKIHVIFSLATVAILFFIDLLLALAIVVMLVVCCAYSFAMKKRSAIGLSALATAFIFVALTLYGVNNEWRSIASMTMFKQPSSIVLPESSWKDVPLTLSFLGAIAGLVYLYRKKLLDEFLCGGFTLGLSLCTVFIFSSYAIPLILPLALLPLKLLMESFSVNRQSESEGEVVVINMEGGKFLSALLSVLVFISLLNAGYYVVVESPASYISSQDLSSLMRVSDWIMDNLTQQGLVAAPTSLAPLLEGYLGPWVLSWRERQDALVADAVNDTCFRIVTPHLLVDELEPLSTSGAPIISAYDGDQYVSLLYVADSYAGVKLFRGDEAFFESPYGATFTNYNWTEDEKFLGLRTQFSTSNLIIWKNIRVSKFEPLITITYNATVRTNVKMGDFILPLWVAWGKGIANSVTTGSRVFLVLGSVRGFYSLEVDFKDVTGGPEVARSDMGQEFVRGIFHAGERSVRAEVEIKVSSSVPNRVETARFSIFDLPEVQGARYILVSNSSPSLSGVMEKRYEVLYVDDSFVSFSFRYDNFSYIEAAAYANVTGETFYNGNATRSITYETAGLIVHKNLTSTENNVTFLYRVEGQRSSLFEGLNYSSFEIWIPWERLRMNTTYQGTEASITLDVARIHLRFIGNLSTFKVEHHSQYGQLGISLGFNLNNSSTVGVSITTDKELTLDYIPTTRPSMKGSDVIKLYVKSEFFRELYSSGRYVLLEVFPS